MARRACAEIPALPLQLLLRGHPEWRRYPSAVVAEDLPQSPVLWVNAPAREAGVAPGLRYAAALALAPQLRAGTVSQADVVRTVRAVTDALRRFSPHVEPSADEPGVFWLDASGLERLHSSLAEWAEAVRNDLAHAGYAAVIVVGFTHFGTYAAAQVTRGTRVLADSDEERAVGRHVSLRHLRLPPDTLDALGRLGVRTVDDLLRLPAGGVLERFGPAAARLHRLASGDLWTPLVPLPAIEPARRHLVLDTPESDAQRLLFVVKHVLHPLLARLASRGQALTALDLRFRLGKGGWSAHLIRPASPTLDAVRLADLVRLRLDTVRVDAGVTEIFAEAAGVPAAPDQLALLPERPSRDIEAGTRALDRLRARYGDGAVVGAVLRDGHLPEARFGWEPVAHLRLPRPRSVGMRPLVRRIFERPVPLRGHVATPGEPSAAAGPPPPVPPSAAGGPFIVSGGWWACPAYRACPACPAPDGAPDGAGRPASDGAGRPASDGVHRTYYFLEDAHGELWWVFYDAVRRRWYLHGRVE